MDELGNALADSAVEAVADRLRRTGKIAAAYLLGSAASGRLRSDSDVDIAMLPVRGTLLGAEERLSLAADLGRITGRTVDLGILHTGNLVYAKEAVANGRLILDHDASARARFAMLTLSMYASLQETRRVVLDAYAA